MTQNNEREEFELSISMEYEHPTDLTRDGDGYSDGYVDNAWWGWCKALHYSKSPISQNEQQEGVAYTDGKGDFITKEMYDEYLKLGFYTECIVPLYTSPKQIPDDLKQRALAGLM